MAKERKAYAPFSLTSEAGVAQTPVEGYIDVRQEIYPTVNTGTVNENGKWVGVKASDDEFIGITTHLAVPDAGDTLSPDTQEYTHLDMTGFVNMYIAIKPSRSGNYGIRAMMGPDTVRFANLEPVNAGVTLRGFMDARTEATSSILVDDTESLTADVWNIFFIARGKLEGQKNLQFRIRNSTGGIADSIEVAFLRMV